MRVPKPTCVLWCLAASILFAPHRALAQETRPAPLGEPPALGDDAASRPAPLGRAPGATAPAAGPADPADPADPLRAAGDFVLNYASDPRPDRVPGVVDTLQKAGWLSRDGGEVGPTAGFLRRVFADNGPNLAAWADAWQGYPPVDRRALVTMLWAADTDAARAQMNAVAGDDLRGFADGLAGSKPAPLTAVPFDSPLVLDALWGAWFASGDAKYPLRIAGALPLLDEFDPSDAARRPSEEQLRRFAVGDAARWSLTSNAARDKRLRDALREGVDKAPPEVRGKLARVVAAAEAGSGTGNDE